MAITRGNNAIVITDYDIIAMSGLVGGMLEHIKEMRETEKIPGYFNGFMTNLEEVGELFIKAARGE